jgi:lipopolysaccharide biosynthesis protein
MPTNSVRLIAFYLPQYHPIPENDAWWGKGFTEWTNVSRATPLFPGHYQPHLPADLGFYDLRLADARQAQADLAAQHGLDGFCYYHYWFGGKRLLERPFNDVLASGKPKLPFCLCWANESWSRSWLGVAKDVFMPQSYSLDDDVNHARWLIRAFSDSRYIQVEGRPIFLVYRPTDLLDPQRTTDIWRSECVRSGLPDPYLVGVDAHSPGTDFRKKGFDSTLVFEPQLGALPESLNDGWSLSKLRRNVHLGVRSGRLKVYDYLSARRLMLNRRRDFPFIPTVFVGWDNTPRRGRNAVVMINSTPDNFERSLIQTVDSIKGSSYGDGLVFINAWNEWAEGNHLEPDQKYGLSFLQRLKHVAKDLTPAQ